MRTLATLHPEGFHGRGRTRSFFEGWYVKLVSADRAHRWAVIPGVFLGPKGDSEAFVQVLDGGTRRSWYHRFELSAFSGEEGRFDVRVGESHFTSQGVSLQLADGPLRGELHFSALKPWPVTVRSPGVMGWYAWVPFMECYHGVLGFSHELSGSLDIEGKRVSFDGGLGYLEKDWGAAFPAAYVWQQTNHFTAPDTCLSASVAVIPWLFTSFRGFVVGLWHQGTLYRFATYTGARVDRLEIDDAEVRWTVSDRRHRLELRTERRAGGLLHAPTRTQMHRRIEESLDAVVQVRLTTLNGKVLLEDTGACAGLEVSGDLKRLTGGERPSRG